jgi:hypothetical protein
MSTGRRRALGDELEAADPVFFGRRRITTTVGAGKRFDSR